MTPIKDDFSPFNVVRRQLAALGYNLIDGGLYEYGKEAPYNLCLIGFVHDYTIEVKAIAAYGDKVHDYIKTALVQDALLFVRSWHFKNCLAITRD